MSTLMSLGQFVFGLTTLAPETISQATSWRYAQGARVGARPSSQFLGPDVDGVTLQGVLWPELIGDAGGLNELRQMGDAGQAYPLMDGSGRSLGSFVIEKVHDERSILFPDGSPQKISFTVDLHRVDDPSDAATASTGGENDDSYFFDDDFNDQTGSVEDGGFTGDGSGGV